MFKIKRIEENAKIPKKEHFWNKYKDATIVESDQNPQDDVRLNGDTENEKSIAKNMWENLKTKKTIDDNLKELFGDDWSLDIIWQKIQIVFWLVAAYFSLRFAWYLVAFFSKSIQLGGPKNLLKVYD